MVESISWMEYPTRCSGVATASTPRGAVASLLANDGKKKTTFLDIQCVPRLSGFSKVRSCVLVCHRRVTHLSFVDQWRLDLSRRTVNWPFALRSKSATQRSRRVKKSPPVTASGSLVV